MDVKSVIKFLTATQQEVNSQGVNELGVIFGNIIAFIESNEREAALGRAVFKVFQNNVENQKADCPIDGFIDDCEDCPFSDVCDMAIELERFRAEKEAGE